MGSCAAPSAKGDDKFITTDYLQQCLVLRPSVEITAQSRRSFSLECFAFTLPEDKSFVPQLWFFIRIFATE
ncbi:hypothetical protein, partial [Enterobacter hormaechei]|uniref:hypothetical protein n=1 Tax=Enterobacter hormaechei TaxID=158836 RepID=UPI002ACAEFC4